jgi:hypothetical protein
MANDALSSLTAPLLTTVPASLTVMNNPRLPTCQVTALAARLQAGPQPPQVIISKGNDDSATCP